MKYPIAALLLGASFFLTACGGGAGTETASEQAAEITECSLSFPKVHEDQRTAGDTVQFVKSVYVENFTDHDLCWAAMKQEATRQAQSEGVAEAEVLFFDCPHHHPALKVDSTTIGPDYQVHCVAAYVRKADGTETFVQRPYAEKVN